MTRLFVKGDRVKASGVWLARSKWATKARKTRGGKWYTPDRLGTVVNTPRGNVVAVRWDGNAESSINHMHNTFLTRVVEAVND